MKNYVGCLKCKLYMPLHHPQAIAWSTRHNDACKEWLPLPIDTVQNLVGGEEHKVYVVGWQTAPEALIYTEDVPPGYESAVGLMEQLAYATAPEKPRLD